MEALPIAPTRDDAHPRAVAALTDDFFWDVTDACGPLGSETGREIPALFEELQGDHDGTLGLLGALLARWEVADAHWDATTPADVTAAGEDDEYALLMRDEIVLALAFVELMHEGGIDPEIQRRALLATIRQGVPLVLAPWGGKALERATKLDRMREVLSTPRKVGPRN